MKNDFEFIENKLDTYSQEAINNLINLSDSISDSNGLLLLHKDRVIIEHYQLASENTLWDTQSVTKSFGASLLILALDMGLLKLNENVCGRKDMTIHHLASMTAGFPKPSDIKCGEPLLFPPGTDFAYSDGGSNILGDIIKRALNVTDIRETLKNEILAPIGANKWTWDGRFNTGMHITIRDMTRYGRLWLRKGDRDGNRISSEKNAVEFTRATNPEIMKSYGYLWWVNSHGKPGNYEKFGFKLSPVFDVQVPRDAFIAIGASFTLILVISSRNLIAVRSGTGFHSIQSGDTKLCDVSRDYVNFVLDVIN